MESEVSSLKVCRLFVAIARSLHSNSATGSLLLYSALLALAMTGCDSETTVSDTPDGGLTDSTDMTVDDSREASVAMDDASVIVQCPEETEDSWETAVFSDCARREGRDGATTRTSTASISAASADRQRYLDATSCSRPARCDR